MTEVANMTDDPEIALAMTARRQRLADASQRRADAHSAHEAKVGVCRQHAEENIVPVLRDVAEQLSREVGIKAEIEDDLAHASPWMAFKVRIPPRSAEVRFTFDVDKGDVTIRTTGEGETGGPRLEKCELAELTTDFVRQQVRDAVVHAAA